MRCAQPHRHSWSALPASVGHRMWRGLVALLALSSGVRGASGARRVADVWEQGSQSPIPPRTLQPASTLAQSALLALGSRRPSCPMPHWRTPAGRPPGCMLMLAWDRIDIAAERLDSLAAHLALSLRQPLGAGASELIAEVRATAQLIGQLRMSVARRASHYVTASWTTSRSGVSPRLAADIARAAARGQESLAACQPALAALLEASQRHLGRPKEATTATSQPPMATLFAQLERELGDLALQATRWAMEETAAAAPEADDADA